MAWDLQWEADDNWPSRLQANLITVQGLFSTYKTAADRAFALFVYSNNLLANVIPAPSLPAFNKCLKRSYLTSRLMRNYASAL